MNKSGNENRSVRNTKKRLQESLLTLIQTKTINEISVKELTELADVNRGTFYFHYSDIYDMLYKIEDEFFIKFDTVLNTATPEDEKGAYQYLKTIFSFLGKNHKICRMFFSTNCDMHFFNRIKHLMEERCCSLWEKTIINVPENRAKLYNAFIINGCAGIMQQWLDDNLAESSDEISELVLMIISSSVKLCISPK